MKVYLDIETLPDMRPGAREAFIEASRSDFKAPSDMTKGRAIAELGLNPEDKDVKYLTKEAALERWAKAFRETKADEVGDAEWRKTSCDPTRGHICVIGWAIDDGEPVSSQIATVEDERRVLQEFFNALSAAFNENNKRRPVFIGHYEVGFDLPFIYKRAVILGVRPPLFFPNNPREWDDSVFDTMYEWAGRNGRISMDSLCEALGLEGKTDMDGSMVCDAFLNGEIDKIASYCRDDVTRTRNIERRLTFYDPTYCPLEEQFPQFDEEMPEFFNEIAPGATLEDIASEGFYGHVRFFGQAEYGAAWAAILKLREWADGYEAAIRNALADGKTIFTPDGRKLVLTREIEGGCWLDGAEEKLKSFGLKKDEMYDQTLISPAKAEELLLGGEKPSKVLWERLQPLIAPKLGEPRITAVDPSLSDPPEQSFEEVQPADQPVVAEPVLTIDDNDLY